MRTTGQILSFTLAAQFSQPLAKYDLLNSQLNNYCLQSNYTALKSQADATTLLLTGGSWDAYYQYLNLHI